MPTQGEYRAMISAVCEDEFDHAYSDVSGARHVVAMANSAAVQKRNELTQGITKAWKDGFAALKAENDQMQKDLHAAFTDQMKFNADKLASLVAQFRAHKF